MSDWKLRQIWRDLSPFLNRRFDADTWTRVRSVIDRGLLSRIFVVSIRHGRVSTYPNARRKRPRIVRDYIRRLISRGASLPEVSFLLGDHDGWNLMAEVPETIRSLLPPVFVFAADENDPYRNHYVLMPDDHTIASHLIGYRRGWRAIRGEVNRRADHLSCLERAPVAYWRGLDTDHEGYEDSESPRHAIVRLSGQYPRLIDAAFTHTRVANRFVVKNLRPLFQRFGIPPYVSIARQLDYRILVNLDGRTCTYPGLLWRLYSGSVVLKQATSNVQWFYGLLRPMEHYVPMERDASDAIEKIGWILRHPSEAEEIAGASRALVDRYLRPEDIDDYFIQLLRAWASLTSGDQGRRLGS